MIAPSFVIDWTTGLAQPGVDVVRAGVATFVGSNGFIQSAAENTQRVDYSTSVSGLLIEESRNNLLFPSNNFAAWTPLNSSISLISQVSPDGSVNSQKLVDNATNGLHRVSVNGSVTSGTRYVMSIYVRAEEITQISLKFSSVGFGVTAWGYFDLNTLLFTQVAGTFLSTSIEAFNGGWYRISASMTATATASSPFHVELVKSGTNSYAGASEGLYLYGAQLEVGSETTSYIPTTSAAVTRNADVATITGTNFSDWWQASKGGVLVRARPGTVSGTRPWIQFDDGTANEIIALRGNTTNPELYIVDGGVVQAQIDAGTIAANIDYNLTGWWATNDCKARLDSGAVVTDTSATIPTVTQARLGSDGTNYLNGHLASISYYDSFSEQIYTRRKNKAVFNLM